VIQKTGPDGEHTFHLFVRPKDAKAEQWDGARSGEQAALDVFNADEVRFTIFYIVLSTDHIRRVISTTSLLSSPHSSPAQAKSILTSHPDDLLSPDSSPVVMPAQMASKS
jgi:hypothetical protein